MNTLKKQNEYQFWNSYMFTTLLSVIPVSDYVDILLHNKKQKSEKGGTLS